MLNCLVLGSGRSGTSMVAGMLSSAGYYMGDNRMPATMSNPKGYYESFDIEAINEDLLANVLPSRPKGILGRFFMDRPVRSQRWLAQLPLGKELFCPDEIAVRIKKLIQKEPFCFKDPRFCYTLPVWRPFLQDMVFICVFREPARTAHSIVKECRDAPYLHSLSINFSRAVGIWTLMYRHILEVHRHVGEWLFVHYDQVLDGSVIAKLESALGVQVDRQFPDPQLKRSPENGKVGSETLSVYDQLCELAQYRC
jgi:hypothetical protein